MAEKKKILSNWIVRNLLMGAAFILILTLAVTLFLSIRTRHGKEVTVPDFSNMSVAEASSEAGRSGLKVVVYDSVFVKRMQRGAVVSQLPKAGDRVKPGRKIELTINSVVPKKVTMPDLVHVPLRQARAELNSRGLVLGRLSYVSDMATNIVLRQKYRGTDIAPGRELYSGSVIDLVLGLNGGESQTYIPDMRGVKYLSAVDAIHDNGLNISALRFDETVTNYTDSLNAVVYMQRPAASGTPVIMGASVSLFLTLDADKYRR